MNFENWFNYEVKQIREKIKILETRQYQMIFLCATGFATVIGFSEKIPGISIPFILFILLFISENIYYNSQVSSYFLQEYLLEYSKKYNEYEIVEDSHKNYFHIYKDKNLRINKFVILIRLIYKWAFYPFLILPLAYMFFSGYYVYLNLNDIRKQGSIIFCLLVVLLALVFFGYIYVLIRNYRLRKKTINLSIFNDYKDRIKTFLNTQ